MFKHGVIQAYADIWSALMRALDPLLVVLTAWLSYFIYHHRWLPVDGDHFWLIILTAALVVILFPYFQIYHSRRGETIGAELQAVLSAWITVLIIVLFLGVVTKTTERFSRLWFTCWAVAALGSMLAARLALRYGLRQLRLHGRNQRRIVIVGAGELGHTVAGRLLDNPWTGLKVLGFFDDEPADPSSYPPEHPLLGNFDQLADYVHHQYVDQVWLAIPWSRLELIDRVLYHLRYSTADIRLVPDLFSYRLLNTSISEVAGLPVFNLSTSPIHGVNRLVKGLEDRLLAGIILVLISPLLLAITLGVKLSSPGPIIFRQQRHGYDGREVEIWKFRTMKVHEEQAGDVTQATHNDPRVTSFGSFLRKTSLDELPQFINVLQGQMSIVGPRPHAIVHNEYYKRQIDHYVLRHKVKPGITGWAQVNGFRGETETLEKMQKRVEYDLYYIEHWSLWFDIKIILMTLVKGFRHKNAY